MLPGNLLDVAGGVVEQSPLGRCVQRVLADSEDNLQDLFHLYISDLLYFTFPLGPPEHQVRGCAGWFWYIAYTRTPGERLCQMVLVKVNAMLVMVMPTPELMPSQTYTLLPVLSSDKHCVPS